MKKKIMILSCLLTAASAALQAAPIAYNLTFTLVNGSATPTGSFNYDSVAASPFSAFTVNEAGLVIDQTSSANAFTGNTNVGACKSSQSPAGLFHALSTAGCQSFWVYTPGSNATFQIGVCGSTSNCNDGSVILSPVGNTAPGPNSIGLVAASPATATPEPGTASLLGAGALVMMATVRARRKRSIRLAASGV